MTWRNVCIVLGLACCWLQWRDCNRPRVPLPTVAQDCTESGRSTGGHTAAFADRDRGATPDTDDGTRPAPAITRSADGGLDAYGFHVPGWAVSLAPQQGEDMLAYRDRMVPLAQAAVAPQRSRVARGRDNLAALVGLDTHQRAELDAATQETATAIQDRVLNGLLGGEFSPQTFKPMTGIAAARELLDLVDHGNKRFLASLTSEQRTKLAQHPFDFADYLLFSTRWEDVLGAPQN